MAGHSKWANIRHRKGKADAVRGKIFSRIAKEIISAVKQGGADVKSNTKLKMVLQKARAANVPNDVIERNVKKASSADQADFTEMTYELYGHGGVGIVVDVMTDNKNRISSDMRIATNKKGGTIATPGSVVFNFDRKGVIQVLKKNAVEDELFMMASDAGAEDFEATDDAFIITTPPDALFQVKEKLDQAGIITETAEHEWIPKSTIECNTEDAASNMALVDWIEALDDVDSVTHNMQM